MMFSMKYQWLVAMLMIWAVQTVGSIDCPRPCHCTFYGHHQVNITCKGQKLQKIPDNIPEETVSLTLANNLLSHIPNNAFSTLVNLIVLSLKHNNIAILDEAAFAGLGNLRYLYLTKNSLSVVQKETLAPMIRLEELYLTDNHIQSIPDLSNVVYVRKLNLNNNALGNATFPDSFRQLKALKSINLNNNPKIEVITKSDFNALTGIEVAKLSMERCGLQKIENGTFSVFPKLISLILGYNKLPAPNVRNIIAGLRGSTINSLDLSGVITSGVLPANTFDAMKGVPLLHLTLRHSQIDNLLNQTFKYFTKLQSLDLSYSRINVAEPESFFGLIKLQTLLLYRNRFKYFPKNLPPSCRHIDMSHNNLAIPELDVGVVSELHHLKVLSISDCKLTKIATGAFRSTVNLERLDLSNNALPNTDIGSGVFEALTNLEWLDLSKNKFVNFHTEHSPFIYLLNLKSLNMSNNNCEQLPPEGFTGLDKLESLDFSKNNLGDQIASDTGLIFKALKNLVHLNLSSNNIRKLQPNVFSELDKLKELRLDYNDMSEWNENLFASTHSLATLNLARNQISVINQSSLHLVEKSLKALNLADNPFSCYCNLRWFRGWINTTNITLLGVDSYTCSSPKNMLGKPVLTFKPASIESECSPPPWVLIIIGVATGIVVGMCIFGIVSYRNRWKLRLWMYLRMKKRREAAAAAAGDREGLVNEDPGDRFKFDCFVSVSDRDEDWVKDVLLPRMDNNQAMPGWENQEPIGEGRHSLCCSAVHLIPGNDPVHVQVANAISDSRKVMLLLTREYLRSRQQMQFELELALRKVTEQSWSSIILVILEPGADVRIPHGRLHELLDNGEEIKWSEDPAGQEVFWNRLTDRLDED